MVAIIYEILHRALIRRITINLLFLHFFKLITVFLLRQILFPSPILKKRIVASSLFS